MSSALAGWSRRVRLGPDALAGELVRTVPALATVAARAWWRTTEWSVGGALALGGVVVDGVLSSKSAIDIVDDLGAETRRLVLRALGETLSAPDRETPNRTPIEARFVGGRQPVPERSLAERVADLLEISNEIGSDERSHPAYRRVIDEIAPDEARILRLFAAHGPQAAVDVRTRRPLGVGSELVTSGITMIGRLAGCARMENVPAYLDNLSRLGLIWFSPEPLADLAAYQVLEVQPEVTDALSNAGRGTTVRRSIELTAFGRNFCETCGLASAGIAPSRKPFPDLAEQAGARDTDAHTSGPAR